MSGLRCLFCLFALEAFWSRHLVWFSVCFHSSKGILDSGCLICVHFKTIDGVLIFALVCRGFVCFRTFWFISIWPLSTDTPPQIYNSFLLFCFVLLCFFPVASPTYCNVVAFTLGILGVLDLKDTKESLVPYNPRGQSCQRELPTMSRHLTEKHKNDAPFLGQKELFGLYRIMPILEGSIT